MICRKRSSGRDRRAARETGITQSNSGASTGVSTRTGSDSDAVGIAWQYRWGGGL